MSSSRIRPAPIRLDDLADPVFPAAAAPMRAGLAGYGAALQLTPAALLRAATERTGLDNWGDSGFRARLDVLCGSLVDEAGLSDVGRALAFEQLVGHLVNRLRLEDLIAANPEIEGVPIERPIIICGLPRTGTTHLHNLIAADPALRYLPYWESLEPVLAEREEPRDGAADPRRGRCRVAHRIFCPALAAQEAGQSVSAGRDQFGLASLDDLPDTGCCLDGYRIGPAEQRDVRHAFQRA